MNPQHQRYETPADRPDPRTPVHVAADIYEQMREQASRDGRSITSMVNRALREWLEQRAAA